MVDERWGFCAPTFVNEGETRTVRMPRDEDKIIYNTGRRCYVEGVNLAAKHATGDILIVVADDQFPCEHWDRELFGKLPIAQPAPPCVLWAPTGTPSEFERNIIVMPIMSRALYEKWGYVFYPGYESMYSDNDLCEHAKAEGVLIEARHLPVFPHRHFLFTPGVASGRSVQAAEPRGSVCDRGTSTLERAAAQRLHGSRSPRNLQRKSETQHQSPLEANAAFASVYPVKPSPVPGS